jgi:divalent metal cation (Fe/Co/Zn/Cd) transporter
MYESIGGVGSSGIMNLIYRKEPPVLNYVSLGLLVFTVITKLLLYFFCRYVYSVSDSNAVDALYHDHFNDVFMNTLVIVAIIVSEYVWWLDSVCAILLSLFIIRNWIGIALENIGGLIAAAAPSDLTRFVTFVAANHHSEVTQIDTVRVYQVGSQYWCEVDIVLPQKMALGQAHGIGESLQILLESMDVVERAFVHIDHEFQHLPEHGKPSS